MGETKPASKRPPQVKVGDRVRVVTVHTGTVTGIGDDGFQLETRPGRPINGSFYGDSEMTWVVLPSPLMLEPSDGSVIRLPGGSVYVRDDSAVPGNECWGDRRWVSIQGAPPSYQRVTWGEVCELARPGVPVLLMPDPFGEPVNLPWVGARVGVKVTRDLPRPICIRLDGGGYESIGDEEATELARALWTAANQAERQSGE